MAREAPPFAPPRFLEAELYLTQITLNFEHANMYEDRQKIIDEIVLRLLLVSDGRD
jgi:hypothetical protein